jgi:pyridoxine kinase
MLRVSGAAVAELIAHGSYRTIDLSVFGYERIVSGACTDRAERHLMSGAVIVISSHVARGGVGNRAMVFALERLGFEVWAVPTVFLPHHPGHGPVSRIVPDEEAFTSLLQKLVGDGRAADVAGIVSGYLASPAQAEAVFQLVATVKAARPDALYVCDPVIGDGVSGQPGRLYVAEDLAEAQRDLLVPIADAATPNAFECAWLSGADPKDLERAAAALPPPLCW